LAETTPESRATKADEYTKVGDLYRRLKQKYKEEHNEPEASTWHYNEKEMFRKSSKRRRYSLSLTDLYFVSSGYAERPVRAFFALIVLIVLYMGVMACFDKRFIPSASPPASIKTAGQGAAQAQAPPSTAQAPAQAPVQASTKAPGQPPVQIQATAQAPTKAVGQPTVQVQAPATAQAPVGRPATPPISVGAAIDSYPSPESTGTDGTFWRHIVGSVEHILAAKTPEFEPITLGGKLVNLLFTRLIIPFQAIFLGLALRNKFRR
ncbi:MAG: hypothetical protein HQK56_19520, partial [Deltaproteobacteria bacterium]|nr:hypothetical protein [Deltaproteobacteria bacterium]